jgi:hypothetical protein
MSFGFHNAAFVSELGPLTNRIGKSAFTRPAPKALYHYKRRDLAEKIIATRKIWATCVTAQEDLTEVTHGIAIVERVAMDLIDREPNLFVRRFLAGLAEFMRTRRDMIFVTCFCGAERSKLHSQKYGAVCFKFNVPQNWTPELECENCEAESWYSPVIYGEKEQVRAVSTFLKEVTFLLRKHSSGRPEDDKHGFIGYAPIRDAGLCLLTIVSSFKREAYESEEEWRLIVMPKLALTNSAPKMIDDAFGTCIVKEPKRHICLRRKVPFIIGEGSLWPPAETVRRAPFDEVIRFD